MKFYADENVPKPFVRLLREAGHEVDYVVENVRRLRDHTILREALNRETLVLTLDKDYKRLVFEEMRPTLGVVWVRLSGTTLQQRAGRVVQVIQKQGDQPLHHFTIIYNDHVEVLSLPAIP
jgi:predicted nuclease of predicted toxin-antitoxin system